MFMIDEGPQLRVRGIEFAGNKSLPAGELAEVVSVRKYPPLGLGAGGYVTGKQMEQDVERIVDHYRSRGFLEAKAHAEAATSPAALGQIGAVAAGADTVSRDAKAIFVRYTIEEGPRLMLASEDFRTAEGEPLPYDKQFLLESVTTRPGDPYTPQAVRDDGRRLERLLGDAGYPGVQRRPRRQPQRRQGQPDLGAEARTAGSHRSDLRPRQLQDHARDDPGADPAPVGRLPHDHRGRARPAQPRLPAAVQQRDTDHRSRVRTRTARWSRWWSRSRSATSNTACCTRAPACRPTRSPPTRRCRSASSCASATRIETSGATAGPPPPTSPTARRCSAAISTFLDRRFLGTLFRFDISLNYLQQETVRLGDIRSGAGSIGFSREMYPGIDAGLHYNLRNTTHTEPLIRVAGPDETISSVRLGTTVGSLSAFVEWLRMDNRLVPTRGFRINALAELALPALSAPLRPFPLDIGDDTFLKVGVRSLSVIPVGRFFYLRLGFRFEQGFPLGGESLLPKVERYFAGGDTTIRGYQLDRARDRAGSLSRPVVRRPATSIASTTGRWAATCASCRTSTSCSRSARPGTGRCSSTTASSPTRWTACR